MIKKLLLLAAFIYSLSIDTQAQCTPAAQYADSTFGVWPDTTENLPCGFADNANGYSATIDLKTLTDTSVTVTLVTGGQPTTIVAYIEAFRVNAVSGLPTGFAYIPNASVWTNTGTSPNFQAVQGCLSIIASQTTLQGIIATNPQGQDFPLTVTVDAKVKETDNVLANLVLANKWLSEINTAGIQAIPVVGYTIKVRPTDTGSGCAPLSINELNASSFEALGNFPNPFNQSTEIRFNSGSRKDFSMQVRNMVGKLMFEKRINANKGLNTVILKADQLVPGIYFYTITDGKQAVTRKMVVSAN
jgi:hypothetical protein